MENKKIVEFKDSRKQQEEELGQHAMVVQHGEKTLLAVNEVSDYLNRLPIDREQNNNMIQLMTDMLLTAEQEQFLKGFDTGLKVLQIGEEEN